MKKFCFVLRIISASVLSLISLVFTVIEASLMFSSDFLLYENSVISFIQLSLRLIIFLTVFIISLLSITMRKRGFVFESLCIFVSSLFTAPFITNNFGYYFIALSAFFALCHTAYQLADKRTARYL